MAVIKSRDKKIELPDNSEIKDACEELGVPFGCRNGICGACEIEIVKGEENLSESTENETSMGMKGKERLACQCKIKSGEVEIKL